MDIENNKKLKLKYNPQNPNKIQLYIFRKIIYISISSPPIINYMGFFSMPSIDLSYITLLTFIVGTY